MESGYETFLTDVKSFEEEPAGLIVAPGTFQFMVKVIDPWGGVTDHILPPIISVGTPMGT